MGDGRILGILPRRERLARLDRRLDALVFVAALLSVPVAVQADTPVGILLVADLVAWSIFVFEAVVKISAYGRRAYLADRWNWIDLAIIFLSAPYYLMTGIPLMARLGSMARLARLVRIGLVAAKALRQGRSLLSRRNLPAGAGITALATVLAAVVVYYFESRAGNQAFDSFADALWWSVVTLTTVGYGDLSPATLPGRLGAVFLMFVGVAFLGTVAATLASFLVDEEERSTEDELRAEMGELREEMRELREALAEAKESRDG